MKIQNWRSYLGWDAQHIWGEIVMYSIRYNYQYISLEEQKLRQLLEENSASKTCLAFM